MFVYFGYVLTSASQASVDNCSKEIQRKSLKNDNLLGNKSY